MEFVGIKRPIILKDELAAKHEQQRNMSKSSFLTAPGLETPIPADPLAYLCKEENGILFIDVQTGK